MVQKNSGNNKVPKRRDGDIERMACLTFALLGAAQNASANSAGKLEASYRSAEWISNNVPGYSYEAGDAHAAEAFRKRLSRDIALLQAAGVPIKKSSGSGSTMTRIRIDEDAYQLPEVEFTPDEVVVLSVAGGLGQRGGLAVFSQTGWTKLAAAGTRRTPGMGTEFEASNDLNRIESKDFATLVRAVETHKRITFNYRPRPAESLVARTMDPWGMVHRQGRIYLVGYDLERQAARSFRIIRIDSVKQKSTVENFHKSPGNLNAIVDEFLEPADKVNAVVHIPEGTAAELADAGHIGSDGYYHLSDVSAEWLARTAAGYAPDVVVVEPASVRSRIKQLLIDASSHAPHSPQGGDNK